jgi:hypothetical protein
VGVFAVGWVEDCSEDVERALERVLESRATMPGSKEFFLLFDEEESEKEAAASHCVFFDSPFPLVMPEHWADASAPPVVCFAGCVDANVAEGVAGFVGAAAGALGFASESDDANDDESPDATNSATTYSMTVVSSPFSAQKIFRILRRVELCKSKRNGGS